MRIALVAQSCDNHTGIGRVVLNLARVFSERGNDVHVVAQNVKNAASGIPTRTVASFPYSNALNKLAFRLDSSKVLSGLHFDIANAFGVGRGADVVTAGSCHLAGMEIRKNCLNKQMWQNNFGLYDRISLQDEKSLFTASSTKRIIAVSHLVKEQIQLHYDVAADKITIIPNGVDERWFEGPGMRKSARLKLGIQENEFVLLFAGNEFDRKGLETVIRSLPDLGGQPKLIVLGGDNPNRYSELARRLAVDERVSFVGVIPDPLEYFAAVDAFVMPSLYEPFGMVIIEAMAAGVPVITSKTCGAVEGMQHGVHGLYLNDPLSVEEVGGLIRQLMSDKALGVRLMKAGRSKGREFVWSAIAGRTLEVYRSIASANAFTVMNK